VWLAQESGYSAKHISRVARGVEPGTLPFHKSMWRILEVEYKLPREVLA